MVGFPLSWYLEGTLFIYQTLCETRTEVNMWSGGVSYDVGGKGFDPTVGKITETSGEVGRSSRMDC